MNVQYQERFIPYPPVRDAVFILGAGVANADGALRQEDILPDLLSGADEAVHGSPLGELVLGFIKEHFHIDPGQRIYPKLDSIFALLEHLIDRNDALGPDYPATRLLEIRDGLIALIHHACAKPREQDPALHTAFWARIAKYTRNVSVISLTHDTRIDQAFAPLYPKYGFLDYCLHLMNYDHAAKIDALNWWTNPRAPLPIYEGADPRPIKVIKLHGSLNWKYCPCCNQVLLTPWDPEIDLGAPPAQEVPEELGDLAGLMEGNNRDCPLDGTRLQGLIAPYPGLLKGHPVFTRLMDEAAREIRQCRKVVFIGYSFPDSHVHLKALLKKNLPRNIEVVALKNGFDQRTKSAYLSLHPETAFLESSFQAALTDKDTMRTLFT